MVMPNGTTIAANGHLVLAQDPTAMLSEFGVSAVGPWQGRLSSVEETVELRDELGDLHFAFGQHVVRRSGLTSTDKVRQ